MVDVLHLLLANTKSHPCLGFTLRELFLNTDIEALLVKVGSRLVIVKVFKLFGNRRVLLQALIDLLLQIVVLSVYKAVAEFQETLLGLFELLLLDFTLLEIVRHISVRFNLTRGRI